jgi:capsular polysaccharide biosynthesis protein
LKILREHWFGILACTLLGVLAAGAVAVLTPPKYTAKTSIYISAQNGNDAMSAYQGGMFTQARVKSYTELIHGEKVASEVATRLNLSDTPEDLSKEIEASSTLNTVVINVLVTDPSAQRAALIANAVGEVFPQLVSKLEQPTDVNALPTVKASVVQPASIPTRPSSTGLSTMLILGFVAGLLIGAVYAGVRTTLKAPPMPAAPPYAPPRLAMPHGPDPVYPLPPQGVPNAASQQPPNQQPPNQRPATQQPAMQQPATQQLATQQLPTQQLAPHVRRPTLSSQPVPPGVAPPAKPRPTNGSVPRGAGPTQP